MNAHGAHYVANADAKIQPFSGTAITLMHFFAIFAFHVHLRGFISNQLYTKSPETAIFSLFLCNFAVACDCSPTERLQGVLNKETQDLYAEYS